MGGTGGVVGVDEGQHRQPVPDTTSDCPNRDQHTPQPEDYFDWNDWAEAMSAAGSRQSRCPGCGLYAIWSTPTRKVAYP